MYREGGQVYDTIFIAPASSDLEKWRDFTLGTFIRGTREESVKLHKQGSSQKIGMQQLPARCPSLGMPSMYGNEHTFAHEAIGVSKHRRVYAR